MTSSPLIQRLAELVAIDSTSTRSNLPVVDVLQRQLEPLGFQCEVQRYRDDAGVEKANLLGRWGAGLPELSLVGHTDCVPFDAGWSDALQLTERNGTLIGRGSCDTKAFIACAVTAAERVKGQLGKPFQLIFTADEEQGCVGAKKLLEAGKGKTARAIIGEPTSLRPIFANKGYCLAELEVFGKEGHSAYPDTGASAIARAARLVTRLDELSKGALRLTQNPAFTPPFATLNIGVIAGGKAKNIIPGHCRFTLEWRPLPSQAPEALLEQVQAAINACRADDPGFEAKVRPLRMDRGFDTSPTADVVAFLEKAAGTTGATVSFGTEGPQLAGLGAVPVVFGPGDITVAHQTGEFVPVAELFRAADVLEAAVRYFCS